jgi:hypothetical protein
MPDLIVDALHLRMRVRVVPSTERGQQLSSAVERRRAANPIPSPTFSLAVTKASGANRIKIK